MFINNPERKSVYQNIEKINLFRSSNKIAGCSLTIHEHQKDWINSMKDLILVVIIALLPTECDCSRTILVKQFILIHSAASNQKLVLDPAQNPNPV